MSQKRAMKWSKRKRVLRNSEVLFDKSISLEHSAFLVKDKNPLNGFFQAISEFL